MTLIVNHVENEYVCKALMSDRKKRRSYAIDDEDDEDPEWDAYARLHPSNFQRDVQQLELERDVTGERPSRRNRVAKRETEIERLIREQAEADAAAVQIDDVVEVMDVDGAFRVGDRVSVTMDEVDGWWNYKTGHLPAEIREFLPDGQVSVDFVGIAEDEAYDVVPATALQRWRDGESGRPWQPGQQVQVRDDGEGAERTEKWWDARIVEQVWRVKFRGDFDVSEIIVPPDHVKSVDAPHREQVEIDDVIQDVVRAEDLTDEDPFADLWVETPVRERAVARKTAPMRRPPPPEAPRLRGPTEEALRRRLIAVAIVTNPADRTLEQQYLIEQAKGRAEKSRAPVKFVARERLPLP